jgi:hypothetical protein
VCPPNRVDENPVVYFPWRVSASMIETSQSAPDFRQGSPWASFVSKRRCTSGETRETCGEVDDDYGATQLHAA